MQFAIRVGGDRTAGEGAGPRLRRALTGTAIDAAILGTGVAVGWFTAGEMFVAAWLQTAVFALAIPAVLFHAAARAPNNPLVDAGKPITMNDRPVTGKRAARSMGLFFLPHFGLFMTVLGGFVFMFASRAGFEVGLTLGLLLIAARAVLTNVPLLRDDVSFLASHGYAHLAEKTSSIVGRAYLRMVPLHIGIIAVVAPAAEGSSDGLETRILLVILAMTFASGLWSYPRIDIERRDELPPPAGAPLPGPPPHGAPAPRPAAPSSQPPLPPPPTQPPPPGAA